MNEGNEITCNVNEEDATAFSEVYNMFLESISDDTLLQYEEDDRLDILNGLRKRAGTRFKACKVDLHDVDEECGHYNNVLSDEEKLILATIMKKYWLSDKIYNLDLIRQRMTTKDWKRTSQANHLLRLTVLNKELEREISTMIVHYTVYAYRNKE